MRSFKLVGLGAFERTLLSHVGAGVLLLVGLVGSGCQESADRARALQGQRDGRPASPLVPAEIALEQAPGLEAEANAVRLKPRGSGGGILQRGPALLGSKTAPLDTAWVGLVPPGGSPSQYPLSSRETDSAFSFDESEGRLTVLEHGEPVFAYNFGMQLQEGVPEQYRRAGYVHPVWGPDGTILTDDFPEDHYHHRGVSWMWPRVRVGDEQYDLWHIEGVRQVFERWLVRRAGPAAATVGATVTWRTEAGAIVDERVWVRAFPARDGTRALDVRLTLEAAGQPVTLLGQSTQDKGYGGFSFRFAPRDSTVIVSPEGREADSDHRRLRWADQTGRFQDSTRRIGAAIFQHPSNPEFPAQWTLRHYGFLGVAWPGNDGAVLKPGEPVTLRYRIWIHDGDAEEGRVGAAYDAFVNRASLFGEDDD